MPQLSSYSNYEYKEGEYQNKPWNFWTEQQKSLVIREGYRKLILTSKQVKPYINASRAHFYTQWLGPISAALFSQVILRNTLFRSAYRRNPTIGLSYQLAFLGVFTIGWLNLNPYYIKKQKMQKEILSIMWGKIGSSVKLFNDLVPKSVTSSNIDKDTYNLYQSRNGIFTGILDAEEDSCPEIIPNYTKGIKKISQ